MLKKTAGLVGLTEYLKAGLADPNSQLRAAATSTIGAAANRLLQIGALFLAARLFETEVFDAIATLVLWSGILGLAVAPGFALPLSAALLGAYARQERSFRLIAVMLAACFTTTVSVAVGLTIITDVEPATVSKLLFGFAFASLAGGLCLQAVSLAVLMAQRKSGTAATTSFLIGFGQLSAILVAYEVGAPLIALAIFSITVGILSAGVTLWNAAKYDLQASQIFSQWSATIKRIPVSLIGSSVVEPTNLFVLSFIFVKDDFNVGVVTIAQQWMSLVLFIPAIINQIGLPALLRDAQESVSTLKTSAGRLIGINSLLVTIPSLVLLLANHLLLDAYNQTGGAYVLSVLIVAAWLGAVAFPFGTVMIALDRFMLASGANIFWAVAFIGSSILLATRSTAGFAEARLVAYALFSVFGAAVLIIIFHYKPNIKVD